MSLWRHVSSHLLASPSWPLPLLAAVSRTGLKSADARITLPLPCRCAGVLIMPSVCCSKRGRSDIEWHRASQAGSRNHQYSTLCRPSSRSAAHTSMMLNPGPGTRLVEGVARGSAQKPTSSGRCCMGRIQNERMSAILARQANGRCSAGGIRVTSGCSARRRSPGERHDSEVLVHRDAHSLRRISAKKHKMRR